MTKVLFVTNFCPYYRVRTFEMLAQRLDIEFVFFSKGDEWYWERRHGVDGGAFRHRTVVGFRVPPGIRVTPGLWPIVWRAPVDAYIKDIDGPVPLLMTLAAAKLRGKPFVLWTGIWQHPRTVLHRLTYPVARWVYHSADAIVVYGEHVKQYLQSLGVQGSKIFVAPHAVDNAVYEQPVSAAQRAQGRDRLGVRGERVVLYVGRLETSKGVEVLLRAFAAAGLVNTVLGLVGEGTRRAALVAESRKLRVEDRVVFTGYVPPDQTVAIYAAADVLVLPSVSTSAGSEPWGLVVNEAMNQGVPVIATTAVGAARGGLVQPGVNGEIVTANDADALAAALRRVMLDDRYLEHLRTGARRTIGEWDNRRMTDGFVAAVDYGLARRGADGAGSVTPGSCG